MKMIFSKLSIINNKIIFSCKQKFTTSNCTVWAYNFEHINKINRRSRLRTCSITKALLKNFAIFTGKHLRWSLAGLQVLRTLYFKTSEIFISEFENKKSLCNAIFENAVRKKQVSKDCLNYLSDNYFKFVLLLPC